MFFSLLDNARTDSSGRVAPGQECSHSCDQVLRVPLSPYSLRARAAPGVTRVSRLLALGADDPSSLPRPNAAAEPHKGMLRLVRRATVCGSCRPTSAQAPGLVGFSLKNARTALELAGLRAVTRRACSSSRVRRGTSFPSAESRESNSACRLERSSRRRWEAPCDASPGLGLLDTLACKHATDVRR